jgi:O-antigen ligase
MATTRHLSRLPERLCTVVAVLSIVALLAYPHPSAFAGAIGLVALVVTRRYLVGRALPPSPLSVPFGLYLGGAVVGLYVTLRPDTAGTRFFGLLAALGTFYLVLDRVTSLRAARRIIGAALLLALLGVAFLWLGRGPSDTPGRHPRRVGLTALRAISTPVWRGIRDVDPFGQHYRLTSAGLGMLASYGACLALGPVLAGGTPRVRLGGLTAAATFAIFLVLSGSRTAHLSTAVVFPLFGALRWRWLAALASVPVALAAGIIAGLPVFRAVRQPGGPLELLSRFGGNTESIEQRVEIWMNTLFLLRDFPLTGVGLGLRSPETLYRAYFLPPGLAHAHNIFAQSYLEQGLLGLAGLFAMMAVALVIGMRSLSMAHDAATRSPAISSAAASLSLALNGLMEIGPVTSVGMVLLFGTLGVLLAVGTVTDPAQDRPVARAPLLSGRRAAALSALVALTVLVAVLAPPVLATLRHRPGSRPTSLGQPVMALAAPLLLNLGALHTAHAVYGRHAAIERRRHLEAACAHLERLRAYVPGDFAVYRHLAMVAMAASRPGAASRLLGKAEDIAPPEDGRARFQLARLYQESGDVERAIVAWSRVDPRIGAATRAGADVQLVNWGGSLVRQGQWSRAATVNGAAVRLALTNAAPYRALATAVREGQGQDAALAAMRELAASYPDIPWAYEEVARLYGQVGQGVEARAWDERAKTVWRSEGWTARQQAGSASGDFEEWRRRWRGPESPVPVQLAFEPEPKACGPRDPP